MNLEFFPSSTLPAQYDIVWCRFPDHVSLGEPALKHRPGLVLNIALDSETGESEVQLAYGTTKLKLMQRRTDFFITNVAEMDACGLDRATRFDLEKIAWIPWATQWFGNLPGYSSPVIGRLTGHAIRLLQLELSWRNANLDSVDGPIE